MLTRFEKFTTITRQPWFIAVLLALCLVPWLTTRLNMLYAYQIPPNQTVHPNYFTFHEMSQSWLEGKQLGQINLNRMIMNGQRLLISDYAIDTNPDDKYCMYLALDPGYGIIVAAARKIFTGLPDSVLRVTMLQLAADGLLLIGVFLVFLRIGPIAATTAGLFYAIHHVFAFQSIFAFQYFWEGWFCGMSLLAMILARRCILSQRHKTAIACIIVMAMMCGFSLWVRSSSLIFVFTFLLAMLTVPSLRRYFGIFIIVLSLAAMPQIVRASSVQGHFALSTRMSWHTAFHALGRYPNKYGIQDEDLYAFTTTEKNAGVAYNYCNYQAHDRAIKNEFIQLWEKDPGFIIQSVLARITSNIIYNYNFEQESRINLVFLLAALAALFYALLRRGEALFVTMIAAIIYLGYCVILGVFYYIAVPYGNLTQMAIMFALPVLIMAITTAVRRIFLRDHRALQITLPPLARITLFATVLTSLGFACAVVVPSVREYLFPMLPMQYNWVSFSHPNKEDNDRLVQQWHGLSKDQQDKFLIEVYRKIPKTSDPAVDVARYITQFYQVVIYQDRWTQPARFVSIITQLRYKIEINQAMSAIAQTIPGWDAEKIEGINLSDPESWHGGKLTVKLRPNPALFQSDYKAMAIEKFSRYNFHAQWLNDYELVAHHNGKGCDALRAALAVYYGGYCPYDSTTGNSPLTPADQAKK
jgi:hypothetical protein